MNNRLRFALALVPLTVACTDAANWPDPAVPPVPDQLYDGWPIGLLTDHGFDPDVMSVLNVDLRSRRIEEVDALLLVRGGTLVYEGYFEPATSVHRLHQLNSVTKSVISMAVGTALHQGLIARLDQTIGELLPQYADLFDAEPKKAEITVQDLLTMTSGLAWDDKDPSRRNRDGIYIYSAQDAGRYVLEKPLVRKPGAGFHYSGGDTQLLATILSTVGGEEAGSFIYHQLFHPIFIEEYQWAYLGDGSIDAAGGLSLRARDLARLGQLFLDGGDYYGRQIFSSRWVEDSFTPWVTSDWDTAKYGLQWWMYPWSPSRSATRPYGILMGSGFGGQKLFVVPDLDLVAVFFGCTTEAYDCGISDQVPEMVMYNYILRALE
jgi:CubicO group peptidase (beta-lactamase class C family)